MDYQQALDYLYSYIGKERGAQRPPPIMNVVRTAMFLKALGNPQYTFPSVIVAGTKGKGSTAIFIESIARAAGLRTGLWTSPHLHSYRERIQVDRQPIGRAELVRAIETIRPIVEDMERSPAGAPVTFAIGFGLALRYFAEQRVDLAIIEVGVGGRFDSASVVTPILNVITSISFDHMELLGDTLDAIAWEKAGIMKPGVPTISAPQQPEALNSLKRCAAETGSPLFVVHEPVDTPVAATSASWALSPGECLEIEPLQRYRQVVKTVLPGTFQTINTRLAIGAALLLRDSGLPISDDAISTGLAHARWPGRMEIVGDAPPVVLDGAHNGESIRQLVASLDALFPRRRRIFVFGTSRDKDLARMLPALAPAIDAVVLTASRHPRAMVALDDLRQQLAPYLRASVPVLAESDPVEALAAARGLAAPGDVICVTGSLFVVAAAREALGIAEERD